MCEGGDLFSALSEPRARVFISVGFILRVGGVFFSAAKKSEKCSQL